MLCMKARSGISRRDYERLLTEAKVKAEKLLENLKTGLPS